MAAAIGQRPDSPNLNDFASLALGSRESEASRIDSCLHYEISMPSFRWFLSSLLLRKNVAGCFNWPNLEMAVETSLDDGGRCFRVYMRIYT